MRAVVILDVTRRHSILVCLNTEWLSCKFFFAYYFFTFAWFRSSRLVSIEGDRRLEESSAQHANVYHAVGVYTYGICVEDMYRVCLRGIRMDVTLGWSIGVRYIYLISVILNVYGGYTYIRRFSATVSSFALDIYRYIISLTYFIYSIYS